MPSRQLGVWVVAMEDRNPRLEVWEAYHNINEKQNSEMGSESLGEVEASQVNGINVGSWGKRNSDRDYLGEKLSALETGVEHSEEITWIGRERERVNERSKILIWFHQNRDFSPTMVDHFHATYLLFFFFPQTITITKWKKILYFIFLFIMYVPTFEVFFISFSYTNSIKSWNNYLILFFFKLYKPEILVISKLKHKHIEFGYIYFWLRSMIWIFFLTWCLKWWITCLFKNIW